MSKPTPDPRGFPKKSPTAAIAEQGGGLDFKGEHEQELLRRKYWSFDKEEDLRQREENRKAKPEWYRRSSQGRTLRDSAGNQIPFPARKKTKHQREIDKLIADL